MPLSNLFNILYFKITKYANYIIYRHKFKKITVV